MRVNSIQVLRAVAALLVVYEHSMDLQIQQGTSWQQNIYHLENFGCIGVDLFFVISGFIITYVVRKYNGIYEGIRFIEKRLCRINLNYYIATLIFLGIFLLQNSSIKTPLGNYFESIISSLMDSVLIVPTREKITSFSPILIVGWTLAFEWIFYILFFIIIVSSIRQKATAISIFIILLVSLGWVMKPEDVRIQLITNPIMLEFLLGVMICQTYLRCNKLPVNLGLILLTIGVLCYLALIRFGYGNVWFYEYAIEGKESVNRFLLWGIPSACIVAGCVFMEGNSQLTRVWNNKLLLLAGNASYSIYLIHYSILGMFAMLYERTTFHLPPDISIYVHFIFAIVISIGFYKLVEKPLLKRVLNKSVFAISRQQKVSSVPMEV